jgi:hypothetical protein
MREAQKADNPDTATKPARAVRSRRRVIGTGVKNGVAGWTSWRGIWRRRSQYGTGGSVHGELARSKLLLIGFEPGQPKYLLLLTA